MGDAVICSIQLCWPECCILWRAGLSLPAMLRRGARGTHVKGGAKRHRSRCRRRPLTWEKLPLQAAQRPGPYPQGTGRRVRRYSPMSDITRTQHQMVRAGTSMSTNRLSDICTRIGTLVAPPRAHQSPVTDPIYCRTGSPSLVLGEIGEILDVEDGQWYREPGSRQQFSPPLTSPARWPVGPGGKTHPRMFFPATPHPRTGLPPTTPTSPSRRKDPVVEPNDYRALISRPPRRRSAVLIRAV
jgi:hypothetical protein